MLFMMAVLICCSSPCNVILAPMTSGKNLTRLAPKDGESRVDLRLPFFTSGFTWLCWGRQNGYAAIRRMNRIAVLCK